MKRFIFLLPCILFPYSLFIGLYCFIKGMGNLGEVFSFLPWLFVFALACNAIFLILSIWKKWDCQKVALYNIVVRIIQIPAYGAIFFMGALSFSTLFTMGLAVVLFLFDCMSLFLTGLIGIAAVVRCYASNLVSKRFSVVNGLLQFVFCIDIISAAVIFMKAKQKADHLPPSI